MTWFKTGLHHETIRLAKKHNRVQEHELLILNDHLSQNVENEKTEMPEMIATANDVTIEVESSIFLQEAFSLLTLQQKKVITATVLEERTEKDTADRFGMTQPAVHQMKERALNKLKKHFVLDDPFVLYRSKLFK